MVLVKIPQLLFGDLKVLATKSVYYTRGSLIMVSMEGDHKRAF